MAIGSNLSAFWILAANAWMQAPVGYVLRNGRAELDDFVAVVLNERVLAQAPHVILGGWVTGGLFVLGISAWHLLRGSDVAHFRRSAQIGLVFSFVAALLTATTGHGQAQDTVKTQPMKIAAMEACGRASSRRASRCSPSTTSRTAGASAKSGCPIC